MMDQLSLGLTNLEGLSFRRDGNGEDTPATEEITNPQSTSPRLVHQSSRTSIYRFQDKGIKVRLGGNLGDPQPQQWQVDRLSNEQTISRYLPLSCKRREVLNIGPFDGHPVALYFKWANGITLKEWMRKVQGGTPGVASFTVTQRNYNETSHIQQNHSRSSSHNESAIDSNLLYFGNIGHTTNSALYTSTIKTPTPRATDDLNVRLRAAMAIAKTLSDFHDAGVVINNLTTENVVLDTFEGDYVATFIDLSEAAIFRNDAPDNQGGQKSVDDMAAFEKQIKQEDLRSLGTVLNQLFRGFQDDSASQSVVRDNTDVFACDRTDTPSKTEGEDVRRKRSKPTNASEGLPIYLGSLISTLLLTGRETENPNSPASAVNYESAKDVYLDLKTMLENKSRCFRKTDLDECMVESRLKLNTDLFYGRRVQISMLMHLLNSVFMRGNQPSIATISGHPGTGKSTLASQIKKPIQDRDGFFIEGKFHKSSCPDTVLSKALNSFFGSIIVKGSFSGNMLMPLRWRIHDAIGSGNNLLMDVIPNLRKLMAEETSTVQTSSNGCTLRSGRSHAIPTSSHRLKFMFCKLIGAIACKAHPLILFLDDLQWADEITLDVIRMILTDPDVTHFLLLGAYRDNEVSLSHPLTEKLNYLKEHGKDVVPINIGPLEKECVNTLVSEALCLPPNLCRPLSNAIHTKTGGIIMFLLRFLKSLNDEGLLWFSLSSQRWEFDLKKIRVKEISADVVQHMTLNMTRLDKNIQMGLKTAACVGSNFDAEILQKTKKDDDFDMKTLLEKCVEDGYLIRIDGSQQFAWAHDQVHQAAYELIPIEKRELFHLLLGSRLLMKSSSSELANMLFCVVDNMNRGVNLLESDDQKHELAFLNLRAGESALSYSAFHTASRYLITGLSLLEHDSWEKNYSLRMRLYDAASEALYVTGDFSRLISLVQKPLKLAICFDDKLNLYNNLVRSLAASGQMDEGIATCLRVLAQLGEVIPSTISLESYHTETVRIKTMMQGMSDDQLLSLPVITDTCKMAAMQFLNHLLYQAYFAKPELSPFISFRMVEMSIEYGVCNITPFAFSVYGAFLVSAINDNEGGYRMGRVAMELMKKMNAIEIIPRLSIVIYSMINIWKEPFQASLSKHLEAFDIGAHRGDMEFAISSLFQYVNMSIYGCGENFDGLIKHIQAYSKRALQSQQHVVGTYLIAAHQQAFDFMGVEENAYSLYFVGMTEDSCFDTAYRNNQLSICRYICQKRKYVAFWTGDMDVAAKMYELSKRFPLGSNGKIVSDLVATFIDGLIAFYFARKHRSDEAKWKAIGEDVMV
eukprot:CCRYP_000079-RE/>CCRYP_000079-RE protein AED:0.10 eAED:0.10 QI:211/1/0.88/1/0.5/0.33/9/0/1307